MASQSAPNAVPDGRTESVEDRLAKVPGFDESAEHAKFTRFFEEAKPGIEESEGLAREALKDLLRMILANNSARELEEAEPNSPQVIGVKKTVAEKQLSAFYSAVDGLVTNLRRAYPAIREEQISLVLRAIGAVDDEDLKDRISLTVEPAESFELDGYLLEYEQAKKTSLNSHLVKAGFEAQSTVGSSPEAAQSALIEHFISETKRVHIGVLGVSREKLNEDAAAAEAKERQATAWNGFDKHLEALLTAFREANGVSLPNAEICFLNVLVGVLQKI